MIPGALLVNDADAQDAVFSTCRVLSVASNDARVLVHDHAWVRL
jgi:hypothetical protein